MMKAPFLVQGNVTTKTGPVFRLLLGLGFFACLVLTLLGCSIQNNDLATDGTLASTDLGTLTGFVTAKDSGGGRSAGSVIKDAVVVLDTGEKATTGDDGRFVLKNISTGEHQVSVYYPGSSEYPAMPHTFQSVNVKKNSIVPVTLQISSTGGISAATGEDAEIGQVFGVVESESAVGLAGAELTLDPSQGTGIRYSAGDGTFSIPEVPAGVYTLKATKSGFNENSTTITVEKDNVTKDVKIRLSATPPTGVLSTISGRALDGLSGKPLSVITVSLDNGQRCVSNGTGQWEMKDVPLGDYTVTFEKEGYATIKKILKITSKTSATYNGVEKKSLTTDGPVDLGDDMIVFEFHKQSTLAGTVFNQDGTRRGGHSITVVSVDDDDGQTMVFSIITTSSTNGGSNALQAGEWKIDNVPPHEDAMQHYAIFDGIVSVTNTASSGGTDKYTATFTRIDGSGLPVIGLTAGYIAEPGKTTLMDCVIPY